MRNSKIKIVVDTNVFINSLIFTEDNSNDTEALGILYDLIENNKIELAFSQDTIGELFYILKNKILHYIEEDKQIDIINGIATLFLLSYSVNTEGTQCQKCKDPKDDMFIECAIRGNATYIITNDFRSGLSDITKYKFKTIKCNEFIKMYYDKNKDEVASD